MSVAGQRTLQTQSQASAISQTADKQNPAPKNPISQASRGLWKRFKSMAAIQWGILTHNWELVEKHTVKLDHNDDYGKRNTREKRKKRMAMSVLNVGFVGALLFSAFTLPFAGIVAILGLMTAINTLFINSGKRDIGTNIGHEKHTQRRERHKINQLALERELYKNGRHDNTSKTQFGDVVFSNKAKLQDKYWHKNNRKLHRKTVAGSAGAFLGAIATFAAIFVTAINPLIRVAMAAVGQALSFLNLASLPVLNKKRQNLEKERTEYFQKEFSNNLERTKHIDPQKPAQIKQRWEIAETVADRLKLSSHSKNTDRLIAHISNGIAQYQFDQNDHQPFTKEAKNALIKRLSKTIEDRHLITPYNYFYTKNIVNKVDHKSLSGFNSYAEITELFEGSCRASNRASVSYEQKQDNIPSPTLSNTIQQPGVSEQPGIAAL